MLIWHLGTLKITQEHVHRALSIFVNCPMYTTETDLVRRVVGFVAKYFNDRVGYCYSAMLGALLSVLNPSLACSHQVFTRLVDLGTSWKLSCGCLLTWWPDDPANFSRHRFNSQCPDSITSGPCPTLTSTPLCHVESPCSLSQEHVPKPGSPTEQISL